MNLLNITIPSQQAVVKFTNLVSVTAWCNEDKAELTGYLVGFDSLRQELVDAQISKERLQKIAFGSPSERTDDVEALFPGDSPSKDAEEAVQHPSTTLSLNSDEPVAPEPGSTAASPVEPVKPAPAKKARFTPFPGTKHTGHGRRALANISIAEFFTHDCTSHKRGEPCPHCSGNLSMGNARKTTVISGQALLQVSVHISEAVECKTCGFEDVAPLPEKLAQECIGRYHMSAISVLAYFRYFCGFASHRLDAASKHLSLRVPESTQWDLFEKAADLMQPLLKHLKKKIANSSLLWMDHTHNHILAEEADRRELRNQGDKEVRIGMNTSCYLARQPDGTLLALYHTGPTDAGQYLKLILEARKVNMGPLVVACDALSSNLSQVHPDVFLAVCNAHARRQLVDLGKFLPEKGREILALYKCIFKNDKIANTLNAKERLEYHIAHSLPLMLRIRELALNELLSERRLPTGDITKAFAYILRHFENLSAFCKIKQAPLHTNDVERALKKSILHRKNSLFFQTTTGASVGDLMVSLCMTAHLNGISPVWYLTTLLCNAHKVKSDPEKWLPWNIVGTS